MGRYGQSACVAGVVALAALAAGFGAARGQGGVPVQERPITEAQLRAHAAHGRPKEEIGAALGRPALRECLDDFEVWTYRVDGQRVRLLFVDGKLNLTIYGAVTLEGKPRPCP